MAKEGKKLLMNHKTMKIRNFYGLRVHIYCRIPASDFEYHGKQNLLVDEEFFKRMDIKQVIVSERDTSYKASGCGSVCILVVSADVKLHKLANRSQET